MRRNMVDLWCVDGGVFMGIYGDYGVDLGRFWWCFGAFKMPLFRRSPALFPTVTYNIVDNQRVADFFCSLSVC